MLAVRTRGEAKILADIGGLIAEAHDPFDPVDAIQTIVATTIRTNMDQEVDPDGVPWPPLGQEYADWKFKVAPGAEMGRLYGKMKEEANLRGVAAVANNVLIISYGVDPEAIAHAVKFTYGGIITGTSQPERPFWGITAEGEKQLNDHFEAKFQP